MAVDLSPDQQGTLLSAVSLLVSAFADDGRLDAEEAAEIAEELASMIPSASIFDRLGAAVEDLLYRDAAELRASAARKRAKAEEARSAGQDKRAERLEARAADLEAKADEIEAS